MKCSVREGTGDEEEPSENATTVAFGMGSRRPVWVGRAFDRPCQK